MAILSKIRERSMALILVIGLALFAFVLDPSSIQDFFNSSKINTVGEVGTPNLTHAYFPECTAIGDLCFAKGGLKKEVIYLPKCVAIGTSVTNQFCFWYGSLNNCVLYVDVFNETCNAGGVEGDIAYNLSAAPYAFKNVRYVTNLTAPNAITDLAVNTVY